MQTFLYPFRGKPPYAGYDEDVWYAGWGTDPSMFGTTETLVLNANNQLVQYIFEHKDSEHVPMICQQLYYLAMLAHKPLAPDAMTKFCCQKQSDSDAPCQISF